MTRKPDLFEVLDYVPDTLDRSQLVALCFAYNADVDATLETVDEMNRDFDFVRE